MLPGMSNAVAGKGAGVVAHAQVDVCVIPSQVVEGVRVDDAFGIGGEIVVQRFPDLLGVNLAVAKQVADVLFFLGVDAENGIPCGLVFRSQPCDFQELAIAVGMLFEGTLFERFASAELVLSQQLDDDWYTEAKAALGESGGQLAQRAIGPPNAFAHGVTRGEGLHALQKRGIQVGEQSQTGSAAAPFFRDRPGANNEPCSSSRMPRRIVLGSQSKSRAK